MKKKKMCTVFNVLHVLAFLVRSTSLEIFN